jgi:hypothetical protein
MIWLSLCQAYFFVCVQNSSKLAAYIKLKTQWCIRTLYPMKWLFERNGKYETVIIYFECLTERFKTEWNLDIFVSFPGACCAILEYTIDTSIFGYCNSLRIFFIFRLELSKSLRCWVRKFVDSFVKKVLYYRCCGCSSSSCWFHCSYLQKAIYYNFSLVFKGLSITVVVDSIVVAIVVCIVDVSNILSLEKMKKRTLYE